MDIVSFTQPIQQSFAQDGLETDLVSAFIAVMANEIHADFQDLVDYGCPHIGSARVVERFTKQDGLVVLRRSDSSDKIMQVIFATWQSLGSERGLNFLEFVLKMLWANNWTIKRLWHKTDQIENYPRFLSEIKQNHHFLTSRINLEIGENVDLSEIVELSPAVRKLVPANIVLKVIAKALNKDLGESQIGVACVAKTYNFVRIGVEYDRYSGFAPPYLLNLQKIDEKIICSWQSDDVVTGFHIYRCEESLLNLSLNSIAEKSFTVSEYQQYFIDLYQNFTPDLLAKNSGFIFSLNQVMNDEGMLFISATVALNKSIHATLYNYSTGANTSIALVDIVSIIINRWQSAKAYDLVNFKGLNALSNILSNNAWSISNTGNAYYSELNPDYYESSYVIDGKAYSFQSFDNAAATYYSQIIQANATDEDDYGYFDSISHSCNILDKNCEVTIHYLSKSDNTTIKTITIDVVRIDNPNHFAYLYQYEDVIYSYRDFNEAAQNYYENELLANSAESDDYGEFQSASHSCGITDASCEVLVTYLSKIDGTEKTLTINLNCIDNPDYVSDPDAYRQITVSNEEVTTFVEDYLLNNLSDEASQSFIQQAAAYDEIYENNDLALIWSQALLNVLTDRTYQLSPYPILKLTTDQLNYADDFVLQHDQRYFYRISAYTSTKEKLAVSEESIVF
ncbi:hypothetical protein GCM10023206_06860 [Acinetobacter puyangensis]|uniref:Uncharacterized protein n=1 Tax=Acinetobacter puyangensis TaxID=1096779 RepID=A0A240E8K0_9GAMM|nr:hypothetical protein [Acinetobacter puyangensis]SNX44235.1 hypothetical protein SAMN05421731_102396 [Acinetobacter puyangensis]